MSVSYGAGGATAALGVVGLCESIIPSFEIIANEFADLLFTGDGEAFNVRKCRPFWVWVLIGMSGRSDNS